jgi:elongation factor 3
MEKATRVLSDEDKAMMDRPIEGKNGELRKIEHILGRSKLKKSFQYEVKFKGLDHKVGLVSCFSGRSMTQVLTGF